LAAQAKPFIKVVSGYGSTDGGVAVLGFAKETKLFEKHGLDVVLVGMGTGSVSLRALIAKDLEISSLSGSGLVQAALQGADTVLISALINGFIFKVFGAPGNRQSGATQRQKTRRQPLRRHVGFRRPAGIKKMGSESIFCKSAHHRTLSAPCRPKCSTLG
jgi:hypothetical protein